MQLLLVLFHVMHHVICALTNSVLSLSTLLVLLSKVALNGLVPADRFHELLLDAGGLSLLGVVALRAVLKRLDSVTQLESKSRGLLRQRSDLVLSPVLSVLADFTEGSLVKGLDALDIVIVLYKVLLNVVNFGKEGDHVVLTTRSSGGSSVAVGVAVLAQIVHFVTLVGLAGKTMLVNEAQWETG